MLITKKIKKILLCLLECRTTCLFTWRSGSVWESVIIFNSFPPLTEVSGFLCFHCYVMGGGGALLHIFWKSTESPDRITGEEAAEITNVSRCKIMRSSNIKHYINQNRIKCRLGTWFRTVKLWMYCWKLSTPSVFWSLIWIRFGCSLWQKHSCISFLFKLVFSCFVFLKLAC